MSEYPIAQIPEIPWWSENYALMAGDPEARISLFFGSGRWHGDPSVWRELICINLPDGRTIFAKGYGRNGDANGPGGAFAKLDVLDDGTRFRLTYDGPLWQGTNADLLAHGFRDGANRRGRVDLTFRGVAPIWRMSGKSEAEADIAGALHVEQIGEVNGTIAYDDREYRLVNAYSVRDHSRGPRQPSAYRASCWASGYCAGAGIGYHLYAMSLHGRDGGSMSNAVLIRDGALHPAEIVSVTLPESIAGVEALLRVVLRSEMGETIITASERIASTVSGMIAPYDTVVGGRAGQPSAAIIDSLVRLDIDGAPGFGWSELGYSPTPLA
jgi:hypothetical protein